MPQSYFIAACVFTERHPELGRVIREYVRGRILAPILHKLYRWEARRGTAKGPPPDCPRFSTQMG